MTIDSLSLSLSLSLPLLPLPPLKLNSGVKVIEFVEGEACKFILSSGDHKLHFKAYSLDIKQHWVTALRTAILAEASSNTKNNKPKTMTAKVETLRPPQTGGIVENGWSVRDRSPSPSLSDLSAAKSQFERVSVVCVCVWEIRCEGGKVSCQLSTELYTKLFLKLYTVGHLL